MKQVRAMATFFSWSNRLSSLHACEVKDLAGGVISQPHIRFAVDLNGTRIAAAWGLLHSCIRLNRIVRVYAAQTNPGWQLDSSQWRSVAELEAILDITRTMCTLAQTESLFLAAYGPVLKMMTLRRLRSEEIFVVDLHAVDASPQLPRTPVAEVNMTPLGRTALQRARLEAERRWCGNKSEIVDNSSTPLVSDRERIAILLDLRTLRVPTEATEFAIAEKLLEETYIKYATRASEFDREKEREERRVPSAAAAERTPKRTATLVSGFVYNDTMFDDSDDDDAASPLAPPDMTQALKVEFKNAFKAWLEEAQSRLARVLPKPLLPRVWTARPRYASDGPAHGRAV